MNLLLTSALLLHGSSRQRIDDSIFLESQRMVPISESEIRSEVRKEIAQRDPVGLTAFVKRMDALVKRDPMNDQYWSLVNRWLLTEFSPQRYDAYSNTIYRLRIQSQRWTRRYKHYKFLQAKVAGSLIQAYHRGQIKLSEATRQLLASEGTGVEEEPYGTPDTEIDLLYDLSRCEAFGMIEEGRRLSRLADSRHYNDAAIHAVSALLYFEDVKYFYKAGPVHFPYDAKNGNYHIREAMRLRPDAVGPIGCALANLGMQRAPGVRKLYDKWKQMDEFPYRRKQIEQGIKEGRIVLTP